MSYNAIGCLVLYLLGANITLHWWQEVSDSTYDRNWQGVLCVVFWPVISLVGGIVTLYEWLRR